MGEVVMELTDLEICKRIAEIEGECIEYLYNDVLFISRTEDVYNPLTDDTLCFKFCYDEGILVKKSYDKVNGRVVWSGKYYAQHPENRGRGTIDENPNKAVCLEKIKVHDL
jgi:hypothetical protein